MNTRTTFGFTIIELLVVITIIGLLATVGTVSYSSVQAQARDDVRISDLEQIQLAVSLYRSEEGAYPADSGEVCTDTSVCSLNSISAALEPYLNAGMADPLRESDSSYTYFYAPDRNCDATFDVVTVHAQQMETDGRKNIPSIRADRCSALGDSAANGSGVATNEGHMILIDFFD